MPFKILLLLVILSLQTKAQFYVGIKTGVNSSNQFYTVQSYGSSPSYYSSYSSTNRTSSQIEYLGKGVLNVNVGIQTGYALRRFFTIGTELTYMSTGFVFSDNTNNNITINYMQWNPVVMKFRTGRRKEDVQFFVSSGIGLGFPLLAEINEPGSKFPNPDDPFEVVQVDKVDLKNYVTSPDGSLFIGLGLDIPIGKSKIGIEGRYQGGFTNIYKGDFASGLGETIYNSNLIFQLAYSMFLTQR